MLNRSKAHSLLSDIRCAFRDKKSVICRMHYDEHEKRLLDTNDASFARGQCEKDSRDCGNRKLAASSLLNAGDETKFIVSYQ
jgi:hypothetical protein